MFSKGADPLKIRRYVMKARIIRNGILALAVFFCSTALVVFVSMKAFAFAGVVSNANASLIIKGTLHFLKMMGTLAAPVFVFALVLSIIQGGNSET